MSQKSRISIIAAVAVVFLMEAGSVLGAGFTSDNPLSMLDKLSGEERQRALVENAKKEGAVTIYSIFRGKEADDILRRFNSKYPFIKAVNQGGRGQDVWRKVTTEAGAGKVQADIAIGGGPEVRVAIDKGLVSQYHSPKRKFFASSHNDPDGYWLGLTYNIAIIAYNTNGLKGRVPPASMSDLLKPEWKGDISLDTEPDNLVAAMIIKWGKSRTEEYLAKLAQQDLKLRRGHTLQVQLLCGGEFAVASNVYAHSTARHIEKGCPASIVFPKEFMLSTLTLMNVVKNSPHPFAGALFFDWLASSDGAELMRSYGRLPAREGVEPKYPVLEGFRKKTEIVPLNPNNTSSELVDQTWALIKKYVQR